MTIIPGVGSVGTNGNVVVTRLPPTNYTITAANTVGTTTCSVSVQVTPGAAPKYRPVLGKSAEHHCGCNIDIGCGR